VRSSGWKRLHALAETEIGLFKTELINHRPTRSYCTRRPPASGSDRLVVRSSGVDEDLPGASYAGQYETVLNVSAADLAAAVRHCWRRRSAIK
jgi:phosphoenolpyruvate synthase/pyruvate phosphate dikinase